MDLTLYGSSFDCECGRRHEIRPSEVVFAPDALEGLPALLARYAGGRRVALLADSRTFRVAGARAGELLRAAGWRVEEARVPDPPGGGNPVCDDTTKETLQPRLSGTDIYLAVGSGVVNDLAKWLACEAERPFVVVATAASMNGYASANIAPTLRGVKSLLDGRPPEAVLSTPRILAEAPYELTAAGFGDVLAKPVAAADWRMNHLLWGDYYCPRAVSLIERIEPLYFDAPERLRAREPGAMEALFEALLLTGVSMSMAATSSPSSGGEHMVSHTLDMMSAVDGTPHDLHGRQVGVGVLLASEIYRRVLELEAPAWLAPREGVDERFWGPLAANVRAAYETKIPRLRAVQTLLSKGGAWDRLREELGGMTRSPGRVREALGRAGAAARAEEIGIDTGRLTAALLHAHEIRGRFTILDLAGLVGILPRAAGEIVEAWAR